jgi:plastocyanin
MVADAPMATAAAAATQAVGVGEREFSIAVYRPKVRRGKVKLNIRNLGEDVHDLVVERAGRRVGGLATIVKPGATATLRLNLKKSGTYRLICTIADHEARGMRATLRVVKK